MVLSGETAVVLRVSPVPNGTVSVVTGAVAGPLKYTSHTTNPAATTPAPTSAAMVVKFLFILLLDTYKHSKRGTRQFISSSRPARLTFLNKCLY